MAESTLATTITELRDAVAEYLGLTNYTGCSSTEEDKVDKIIKKGLRQFYFPPPIGQEPPYQWSFLKPVCQLTTIAPYSTGTIAVVITGTTVTLTTGVWPSWTATHGTLVVNNAEYEIASRTSDSQIELSADWTEATETAETFVLEHDANYDLPDDFGGIEGNITFVNDANSKAPIRLVGEGEIRRLRASEPSTSATDPEFAAIRPKEQTTTTTGQRFEIMFWPAPDEAFTLEYKKVILPSALVTTTVTHPYGGAIHAETLEASCLAMAEMQDDDKRATGVQMKYFISRLTASIQADKKQFGVEYLGYNGDNSDAYTDTRFDRQNNQCHPIYKGITY